MNADRTQKANLKYFQIADVETKSNGSKKYWRPANLLDSDQFTLKKNSANAGHLLTQHWFQKCSDNVP